MKTSREEVFWVTALIVSMYGAALQKKPGLLEHESELPYPKDDIRKAIKIQLGLLGDEELRNELRIGKIPIPEEIRKIAEPLKGTQSELVDYLLTDKYYEALKAVYLTLPHFVTGKDAPVAVEWYKQLSQLSPLKSTDLERFFVKNPNFLAEAEKSHDILRKANTEMLLMADELAEYEKKKNTPWHDPNKLLDRYLMRWFGIAGLLTAISGIVYSIVMGESFWESLMQWLIIGLLLYGALAFTALLIIGHISSLASRIKDIDIPRIVGAETNAEKTKAIIWFIVSVVLYRGLLPVLIVVWLVNAFFFPNIQVQGFTIHNNDIVTVEYKQTGEIGKARATVYFDGHIKLKPREGARYGGYYWRKEFSKKYKVLDVFRPKWVWRAFIFLKEF